MMRIVLAYSGDLYTTVAIPWLKARHRADVIAVIADLGQGRALEAARDRALAAGAVRAHVVDVRDEFARAFVLPALRACAVLDDGAPQPEALGRPLLGQVVVDIARIERAVAVGHACEAGDPDQARIESAILALNPSLTLLRPAAEWNMSHQQVIDYARTEQLPVPPASAGGRGASEAGWRADVNLWGRTLRPLRADAPVPDAAFAQTIAQRGGAREAATVQLSFDHGVPTGINGVPMPFVELIQNLTAIAGAHGVGRLPASGGGWVEAPAAVVLHTALRALARHRWSPELEAFANTVGKTYADLVQHGGWFGPLRDGLDAFVGRTQQDLDGVVSLGLAYAACRAVDVTPRHSEPVSS